MIFQMLYLKDSLGLTFQCSEAHIWKTLMAKHKHRINTSIRQGQNRDMHVSLNNRLVQLIKNRKGQNKNTSRNNNNLSCSSNRQHTNSKQIPRSSIKISLSIRHTQGYHSKRRLYCLPLPFYYWCFFLPLIPFHEGLGPRKGLLIYRIENNPNIW